VHTCVRIRVHTCVCPWVHAAESDSSDTVTAYCAHLYIYVTRMYLYTGTQLLLKYDTHSIVHNECYS